MKPPNIPEKYGDSDLKQIMLLVLSNYRLFILCLCVALGLAFVMNQVITPRYKISSSILIKDSEKKSGSGGNAVEYLNSRLFHVDNSFQNEIWILKSTPVIEQTIQNLNLKVTYFCDDESGDLDAYGKVPFQVLLKNDHVQPVGVKLNLKFTDELGFTLNASEKKAIFANIQTGEQQYTRKKWEISLAGESGRLLESPDLAVMVIVDPTAGADRLMGKEYSFMIRDMVTLAGEIKQNISYNVVDKLATVIEIVYKSASPNKGIDIVNEIMAAYSSQNLKSKNHNAEITIAYIERQLNEISDSLRYAEDKLQRFRSYNQLLNFSDQAQTILEQYNELESQLIELESRHRYYNYVMDYLAVNDDFSNMIVPASMGISDQLLNNLMTELINAQSQRSSLILNNQERNPQVQKLNIQISNTRNTISENIAAIRTTTQLEIEEKQRRLSELKETISRLPATQRQLGGIERSYKLNDAIYNYLLEKRAEARITLASNIPDNVIIEPARMVGTKPVTPNKRINILAALLMGFAIPLGLLMTRNLLNNTIDSEDTLELLTDAPVLGRILHFSNSWSAPSVYGPPRSMAAESFSSLRTNVEFQLTGIRQKVILVTSAMAGEGKSFTALNLAVGYSRLGNRTLLLNCDLRNPARFFTAGDDPHAGLSTYYTDHLEVVDIIRSSPYDNLDYIESGPVPENPDQLLAMDKTAQLIKTLRSMYDCIILDTAPLSIVTDTYLLMDFAHIRIIVVRMGYTRKEWFGSIVKEMAAKKLGNVAIVLNDVRISHNPYSRGYGYGMAYGYSVVHDNSRHTIPFKAVYSRLKKDYEMISGKIHFRKKPASQSAGQMDEQQDSFS